MSRLTNLDVAFVSLVDRAAVRDPTNLTEPQRFLLFKRESGAPPTTGGPMPETATLDELRAALTKAENSLAEVTKRAEKAERKLRKAMKNGKITDDDGGGDADDLEKADLPPAVRERIEKAEKRAEAAERIAKAEEDMRVTREFVAKAEADYDELTFDASEFGPVLKRASEALKADDFETLDQVLKAANEQARQSALFKSVGRDGEPAESGSDADRTLAAKAEEIRKSEPGVSRTEAMRRAMRENPDLAAAHIASVR